MCQFRCNGIDTTPIFYFFTQPNKTIKKHDVIYMARQLLTIWHGPPGKSHHDRTDQQGSNPEQQQTTRPRLWILTGSASETNPRRNFMG
jgi:hypothetical protein